MSDMQSLKLLPNSISKLEALRMLHLGRCSSLEYVPCLAALKDLRDLDLHMTNLNNLPEGMEKVVNIKALNLSHITIRRASIPSGFLNDLSLLQELDLSGSNCEVDPNAFSNFKKLEKLNVDVKNFEALNSYLESRLCERLGSYCISLEELHSIRCHYVFEANYDRALFWCKDMDWESSSRNRRNIIRTEESLSQSNLKNLEVLRVHDCPYMEEIIRTEESFNQSNLKNLPTIELPDLYELCIENLPRLMSIYGGNMELPSLNSLTIHNCENLETLPFDDLPETFNNFSNSETETETVSMDLTLKL